MGYPFRIWFTGLCHFVLNRDPNALCRLCVVLPDARGEGHCDHVAAVYHVKRTMNECDRMRIEAGDKIVELKRHRVAFGFTQKDHIPVPGNTDFLNKGLLWMGDIAGGFADQSDDIIRQNPPPPRTVTAQILLESSEVKHDDDISVRRRWEIPTTLTGGVTVQREVADPMFVEFTNVEGARMVVYPMDDDQGPQDKDLSTFREILIANRCNKEEYLGEVKVRQEGEQQISWVQVDKDFKFNFDMLSSASHAAIKRFMGTEEVVFPVPESPLLTIKVAPHTCIKAEDAPPIKKILKLLEGAGVRGTGTGSGGDCLGSQGLARFVDLDRYILDARPTETGQALEARSAAEPQDLEEPGAKLPPVPRKPESWKR